jgi:O-antigen/teichoic acid export membrane protein
MDLTERLARGVKAMFVARSVDIGANAVLLLLLTRYLLTPAEYGLLYFALSVLAVVGLFGSLGIGRSTARYVTEYHQNDPGQIPHLLRWTMLLLGSLSLLGSLVLVFGRHRVASLLGEPALVPFLLLGTVYIVGRAYWGYLQAIFQGLNSVTWSAAMRAVNGTLRLLLATALVLAGFGALGALVGYAVAFVVTAVVGGAVLYWRFVSRIENASDPEPGLLWRVVRYSVPTAATQASIVLDSKVDTVLVGALMNPTAVGFYTLAAQIADIVAVPAESLGFTISPALGEQKAEDRTDRAAHIYESSLEYVLLLYVPAAAGLVLVAEPVVLTIFGRPYAGAVPALQVFGVLVVARGVHKVTGDGLDFLGLARVRAVARGAAATGNFGLNLLLIPLYGVVGAAVATAVTYSAYTAVNVYYVHRELSLDVGRLARSAARTLGVTAVMAGAVLLVMPYVSTLPTLVGAVALGASIWAVLAVAIGDLDLARIRALLL